MLCFAQASLGFSTVEQSCKCDVTSVCSYAQVLRLLFLMTIWVYGGCRFLIKCIINLYMNLIKYYLLLYRLYVMTYCRESVLMGPNSRF